ncbi:hypothetical protein QZH41_011472 [Actinostola sp. cb2023]|nr:hypothetical protein QZH41_011472 [Actinostola sp. cb2023]
MENMASIIKKHNRKVLNSNTVNPQNECNCRKKDQCPLENKCLSPSLVYNAYTSTDDNTPGKNYIGLTEGTFKQRYTQHKLLFRHRKYANSTELSKHIWKLKDENKKHSIKWSIITTASPYSNASKRFADLDHDSASDSCSEEANTSERKRNSVSANYASTDIVHKFRNKFLRGNNDYKARVFGNGGMDNGPHYHNTGFILYLSEVNDAFNLNLVEYNNFEAGEGKTVLDTHFAHVSHKIVRWIRIGNDLESGQQLPQKEKGCTQCHDPRSYQPYYPIPSTRHSSRDTASTCYNNHSYRDNASINHVNHSYRDNASINHVNHSYRDNASINHVNHVNHS